MKVLILGSSEKIKKIEKIKALCLKFGSDPSIYGANPKKGLTSCLNKNDLILIVWDNDSINNPEIIFATGYCVGLNRSFIIFGNDKFSIPDCNDKSIVLSQQDELETFIKSETVRSNKQKSIESAKAALVEMGVDLTNNALVESVFKGESLAFELFLKAGFSSDSCDKNGVSILNMAIRKGHDHIAINLIENGANINSISGDRGNTPLMDAAAEGNVELLHKLIHSGANINLKSKSGQTALVLAVGRQAEDVDLIIIDAGADSEIKDDLGMSALKYAQLFKLKQVLALVNKET
ncbi:MAG: ankyrin repeat domain-containing protein [Spirochaetia bacterium]|jgi:ankyrin repeat protein|nr:ankyrin repeat domain-containing protein [Spirochaetia bacterium]